MVVENQLDRGIVCMAASNNVRNRAKRHGVCTHDRARRSGGRQAPAGKSQSLRGPGFLVFHREVQVLKKAVKSKNKPVTIVSEIFPGHPTQARRETVLNA
jgi:hypothetical protein